MPPAKRWLKILAVQLVIAAVIFEAALRLYNPLPFRLRGDQLILPVGLRYEFANGGDPKLDAVTIHTRNRLGFRGPEVPADFATRLTIVTVGGSTTECFPNSDGRTWPDVMAAELGKSLPRVWVNNAGLDGHSTVGHLALLRTVIAPLKPKVMPVLAGLNDVGLESLDPARERSAAYPYFRPIWQTFANYSEVANTLLNLERARRARTIAFGHEPIDFSTAPHRDLSDTEVSRIVARLTSGLGGYRERLLAISREARQAGIEPVFITQPAVVGETIDPATGADLATLAVAGDRNGRAEWRVLEAYNDAMRGVAGAESILLIDLARQMPKDSRYYYDIHHFGNDGAALVGKIVAAALGPHLVR